MALRKPEPLCSNSNSAKAQEPVEGTFGARVRRRSHGQHDGDADGHILDKRFTHNLEVRFEKSGGDDEELKFAD